MVCAEKFFALDKCKIPAAVRQVVCLLLVMFGWVLFRSDSAADAGMYIGRLFGFAPAGVLDGKAYLYLHDNGLLLLLGAIGSTPLLKTLCNRSIGTWAIAGQNLVKCVVAMVLLAVCTLVLVNSTYNPFIYFRF